MLHFPRICRKNDFIIKNHYIKKRNEGDKKGIAGIRIEKGIKRDRKRDRNGIGIEKGDGISIPIPLWL